MVPDGAAAAARLRLALAVLTGWATTLLLPALMPAAGDLSPTVLLAAVAVAVAAVLVLSRTAGLTVLGRVTPAPRTAEEPPAYLAARVTDPRRFPLRPRAPGRV